MITKCGWCGPNAWKISLLRCGFGDLSENYEYKAAKQELRRCDSRLRYLRRMIDTAKVISADSPSDVVGLFDRVEIYYEEDDESETIQLMDHLARRRPERHHQQGIPLGKAVMGRKVGDRVLVKVNDDYSYYIQIRSIEKGQDDDSLPIHPF